MSERFRKMTDTELQAFLQRTDIDVRELSDEDIIYLTMGPELGSPPVVVAALEEMKRRFLT